MTGRPNDPQADAECDPASGDADHAAPPQRSYATPARDVTDDDPGADASDDASPRATRIVLGAACFVAGTATGIISKAIGLTPARLRGNAAAPSDPPQAIGGVRLVPYAAIGLAVQARHRSTDAATALLDGRARARMAATRGRLFPSGVRTSLSRQLQDWGAIGRAEVHHAEAETSAAVRALIRAVANAVLDQIDLDAVVARVNPNPVVDRVDIDAVLARVDLTAHANQVLDDIDITRLIRESSSGMTAETIEAFRIQNMRADRFVNRVAGRLLPRRARQDAGQTDPPAPLGDSRAAESPPRAENRTAGGGRPPAENLSPGDMR